MSKHLPLDIPNLVVPSITSSRIEYSTGAGSTLKIVRRSFIDHPPRRCAGHRLGGGKQKWRPGPGEGDAEATGRPGEVAGTEARYLCVPREDYF